MSPAAADPPVAGEWLFKRGAEVFGPVSGSALVAMIWDGRVGPATLVCGADGAWRPLTDVPPALVHLRRAEARARVGADLRRARLGAILRRALLGAAMLLVVAGLSWLGATRPWRDRSNLLDDLGPGLELGPVRVGSGRHAGDADEVAVPRGAAAAAPAHARPTARAPEPAAAPARAAPRGDLGEGGVVLAQFDPRSIEQAVARQRASLAPCLRDEARRSPDFAGEIPIEFAVGNDGKVAALWVEDPRFKSGPLRECLLHKLEAWAFDPFPGQRPVVSLSFRIGSR